MLPPFMTSKIGEIIDGSGIDYVYLNYIIQNIDHDIVSGFTQLAL